MSAEFETAKPPHTIAAFCALERISPATYFAVRRKGLGPKERRIPGTRIVRITEEARLEWHRQISAREDELAADLERRRAQAAEAGRRSAASPHHVSRRRRRGQQREAARG